MKIISADEIKCVNASEECFIMKSLLHHSVCDEIIDYIGRKLISHRENERFDGENWHYLINKEHTHFHSFIFNNLRASACSPLIHAFGMLHGLYLQLGEEIDADFHSLTLSNQADDVKTINPLVFWYPAGTGKFDWHQHPAGFQKFQLLVNLTNPGFDYSGGHTHIKMSEDRTEIFDEQFKKGDVFGFPYDLWHKVDPIMSGTSKLNARVSLLMPLHPKRGLPVSYLQK